MGAVRCHGDHASQEYAHTHPMSACTGQLFLERVLVGGDREIVYGARERVGCSRERVYWL